MRLYETTFIVNPQSDDSSLDRQVKAVSDLISSNGGRVIHEDRMGTRRLAYQIQGLSQGYYVSIVFEALPALLPILDRHYRLEEPYIRYLTVLYEGDKNIGKERPETTAPEAAIQKPAVTEAAKPEAESVGIPEPTGKPTEVAVAEEQVADTPAPVESSDETQEEKKTEEDIVEPSSTEPESARFDDEDEL